MTSRVEKVALRPGQPALVQVATGAKARRGDRVTDFDMSTGVVGTVVRVTRDRVGNTKLVVESPEFGGEPREFFTDEVIVVEERA